MTEIIVSQYLVPCKPQSSPITAKPRFRMPDVLGILLHVAKRKIAGNLS